MSRNFYDVVIIGAGVAGTAISRELSRYELTIAVIEAAEDVSCGSTKANSAIVHAGYDAKPGTWMAKFNVEGSQIFEKVCRELSVPYENCGSLVIAFSQEEMQTLQELLERGNINGVKGLKILNFEEVKALEPNISHTVKGALYAPSGAITSPYELAIAYAENACTNGVEYLFNHEVVRVEKCEGEFKIVTSSGEEFFAKRVINAAGIHADTINNSISENRYAIKPKKGNYLLLNKVAGKMSKHVIFQCPSKVGKGVLVTHTVYGNLLIGPDAKDIDDKEDTSVELESLEVVKHTASKSYEEIPFNRAIKTFAGLRAESDTGDFVIGEASDVKGFYNVGGIKSPGLTAAPAIAEYIKSCIVADMNCTQKKDFIDYRKAAQLQFMSESERDEALKNPEYKEIVCRCEGISLAEVKDAISRKPYAVNRDSVKRRARCGMGPCQARHCGPIVDRLLEEAKAKRTV